MGMELDNWILKYSNVQQGMDQICSVRSPRMRKYQSVLEYLDHLCTHILKYRDLYILQNLLHSTCLVGMGCIDFPQKGIRFNCKFLQDMELR